MEEEKTPGKKNMASMEKESKTPRSTNTWNTSPMCWMRQRPLRATVVMHESSSEQPEGPQGQVDVVEDNTWEGMRRPSTSPDEGKRSAESGSSDNTYPGNVSFRKVQIKRGGARSKRRRQSDRDRDYGTAKDKQFMSSDAQTDNKLAAVTESSSSEESQILGKRRRKPVGQWWMSSTESTEETKVPDNHLTHKRSKQHSKEPSAAEASPVKNNKVKVLKKINQKRPVTSTSQSTTKGKAKKTRQNKNRPAGGDAPNKMRATDEVLQMDMEQIEAQQHQPEEEEEVLDQDLDFGQSSPIFFQERDINHNSGQQVLQKVYHNVSEKMSDTSASVSPRGPQEHLRAEVPEKRRRKPPGNWWTTNSMSEEVASVSTHPQQFKPKESKSHKESKELSKQEPSRSPGLGTPKKGKMVVASKTPGTADVPLLKPKPMLAPKTKTCNLARFKEIVTSALETPTVVSSRHTGHNNRCEPARVSVIQHVTFTPTDKNTHSVDAGEFRSPSNSPPTHDTPQDSSCQPENALKDRRSGPLPSSMIEVQEYENLSLQPSSVQVVLSVSDLCAPPLKPLVLQPEYKADLTEMFKTLWPSTVDDDGKISPDHFDWYVYQGKVCGFQVDFNCSSICNGKLLLGSYMKKPLWVDHSATTVFNILTSSVAVIIDGRKSHFQPGQAFMVQSGHAYSINNINAQPAVLYFTRILADCSE